jgi:4-hydroxybenzoate polyprenyltransferase/phosphoserine phosphatase
MDAGIPLHNDSQNVPLVCDVDGTLLKTDLLAESFRALLLQKPLEALAALRRIKNRAAFKRYVAERITLDIATLPVNHDVLELVKEARAQGRKVYLASASDRIYIEALARHYDGLFDGVFASNGTVNLKGETKAQVLCDAFGEGGFDYVGDSSCDVPVWQKARAAIVAGSGSVARKAAGQLPHIRTLGKQSSLSDYAKALRVHQWSKNMLVFVPTVMAHKLSAQHLLPALTAFFSFCFCASSAYLLNDWFDIDHDRQHPEKQHRTLASAKLSMVRSLQLVPLLLVMSAGLAALLPKPFLMTLTAYYALTLAYSLWLKHTVLIDVITLACLYGIRIIAGAALGIPLSEWLVAFSFFLFLSLAMVKRCAELINCASEGKDKPAGGRGYILNDIPAVFSMATASGYVAVLVLAFYIQNPEVSALYTYPRHLWGACLILTYWISRVLLLTSRGEMHEDPVIFAMTDRVSLTCGVALATLIWASV